MLFHPAGQPLTLHTLNITNSLMTMPVQLIAGPIAAYNTTLILGFVLTGFAAYLLAGSLIGRRDIAIAVGAIVTFGPFHIAKLADGHLSWVTFFWVVFYLWCTLHALDTGSNRWRIAAGVVLGGATLTSFYYPLFSFIFTVLLLLTRLPAAIRGQTWQRELTSAAMIGVIAVAVASPLLIPAIKEYRAQPAQVAVEDTGPASRWDRETSTYSADLIDIVFPSPFHALWGTWANQTHQALRYGWFYTITPGIGVLILAAAGVALAGQRARPLAVLVIVLWVLMLGPELRIAGVSTGITLPYDLLRAIPGMSLDQLLPGITPAHQSAQLDAYNIEPVATARPFLFLGSGWNDLERSDTNKWRWMSGESELWIVNPEHVTRLLTIGIVTQSYQVGRTLIVTLDGAPAATFTIEPQIQTIRLPLMLTPGQHTLHLTSPATKEPPPAERLLSLMVLNIAIVPN